MPKPKRVLRVVDLFCGMKGWAAPFIKRGHDVVTLDNDPRFEPDLCMDVREFAEDPAMYLKSVRPEWFEKAPYPWNCADICLMSPPCQGFSMAGKTARWLHVERDLGYRDPYYGPRVPITAAASLACELVNAGLMASSMMQPKYWWLENPQGGLQTMKFMTDLIEYEAASQTTVTYCQYGEDRMKPTTLWGHWPETWKPKPRCYNGDPCHVEARRGAKTGTQGVKGAAARAEIPYKLALSVCKAVEEAMA